MVPTVYPKEDGSFDRAIGSYDPRYDDCAPLVISKLQALNTIVHAGDGQNHLHAPPDPRQGEARETYFKALEGKQHLFEVGFDAGHSALLALECSSASVTSIDRCPHRYTVSAAEFLRREYPGRFDLLRRDIRDLFSLRETFDFDKIDLYLLDLSDDAGVVAKSIAAVSLLCRPGAWILMNDLHVNGFKRIVDNFVREAVFEPVAGLGSSTSGVFRILRAFDREIR